MFLLKQFLKELILPPLPWIVMLALAWFFWPRRWARRLLFAALVLIVVLHTGYVKNLLRYPLEARYPALIDPRGAEPYDAIVVLMAGVVAPGGLIPFPSIDESLFRRLDEAWRLYRLRPKPIIVSGGHVNPLTPSRNENGVACDYLLLWGVPKEHVIPEPGSRDTFESAVQVQKILAQRGWTRYLLVTSAVHMPRSMLAFATVAPEPLAAPGDFTVRLGTGGILPSEDAARRVTDAVYEYVGLINYYWRVREYKN
jgi:uncharacterized SAM-binding protein YcdF (DUF218 family)